jgi:hypothetical protein
MSGRQFVETLKQLGYPKANSLDPNGLEWMFESEELVIVLNRIETVQVWLSNFTLCFTNWPINRLARGVVISNSK